MPSHIGPTLSCSAVHELRFYQEGVDPSSVVGIHEHPEFRTISSFFPVFGSQTYMLLLGYALGSLEFTEEAGLLGDPLFDALTCSSVRHSYFALTSKDL